MHSRKKNLKIFLTAVLFFTVIALRAQTVRPDGWTEETHGNDTDGNYSVVFPQNSVSRIDIIISSSYYQTMENDLQGLSMMSDQDPVYVPATIKFNNISWTKVAVRYKGHSTLFAPIYSNKHKYPFRFNFDKFEDTYPEIKNQRFYGFKKLILSNNWYDSTYIRDKVCSDIFRSAGIPTPQSAFYRVYVDTGNGPVYWGLYTMFEDPSDEMRKSQFEDKDGNLYKGQGVQEGSLKTFNQQGFEKKTNEDENDWSDIQALVNALNASRSDAATWRANLELTFNVRLFLKWLAINTAIVNFDSYGWVSKNYYLYQDLDDDGRLVKIPWDFNLSLDTTNPFYLPIPSLSLDEITSDWPLIRYLMDDPEYRNIYHMEMDAAMQGCFNQTQIMTKMSQLHEMIKPYVVGSQGESYNYTYLTNGTSEFDQGLTHLLNHVQTRHSDVSSYLATVNYGDDDDDDDDDNDDNDGDYTTISTPFVQDGAGTFKWKTTSIPNYINSWNLNLLEINGVDFTNTWVSVSNLPAKQNGYYYIDYQGSYGWSHVEFK